MSANDSEINIKSKIFIWTSFWPPANHKMSSVFGQFNGYNSFIPNIFREDEKIT